MLYKMWSNIYLTRSVPFVSETVGIYHCALHFNRPVLFCGVQWSETPAIYKASEQVKRKAQYMRHGTKLLEQLKCICMRCPVKSVPKVS